MLLVITHYLLTFTWTNLWMLIRKTVNAADKDVVHAANCIMSNALLLRLFALATFTK